MAGGEGKAAQRAGPWDLDWLHGGLKSAPSNGVGNLSRVGLGISWQHTLAYFQLGSHLEGTLLRVSCRSFPFPDSFPSRVLCDVSASSL